MKTMPAKQIILFLLFAGLPLRSEPVKAINKAFLTNNHRLFLRSIWPYIFGDPVYSKGERLAYKDVEMLYLTMIDIGIVDTKSGYIEYSKDTGTGEIKRYYALYFDSNTLSVLVITGQNPSSYDSFTTVSAICQSKEGVWQDCTKAVIPEVSLESLLKEGQTFDPKYRRYLNVLFRPVRRSKTLKAEVAIDGYPYFGAIPWEKDPRNRQLTKLKASSIEFTWNPETRTFTLTQ